MSRERPRIADSRKHRETIMLASLCLFHILFNFLWLGNDFSFYSHPHYEYLWTLETYSLLKSGIIYIYPAYFIITAIIFYIFGPSLFLFNCISTTFLVILIISLYLLGKELWNRRVGLLAAMITPFLPFIFGASRWYDFHTALLAMTVLCYYLLVRTYRRLTFSNCMFLLLVMIIGGLMGKCGITETVEFLVAVSGGWLYFTGLGIRDLLRDYTNKRLYFRFMVISLVGIVSVLYLHNATDIFNLKDALSRTVTPLQDNIVTLADRIASYFAYLVCLPTIQIGIVFTLISLFCLVVVIKKKIGYRWLLFFWFGNTIVFFSLFTKKSVVYDELMLPAIGIVIALGLSSFRKVVWRRAVIISIAIFSVTQYLLLSFYNGGYDIKNLFYYPRGLMSFKYIEDDRLFTRPPSDSLREEITNLVSCIKGDLIEAEILNINRPLRLFGVGNWWGKTCKTTTMLYMALEKMGVDVRIKRTAITGNPTTKEILDQMLPNDIIIIGEEENYGYDYGRLKKYRLCEQTFMDHFVILKEYKIEASVIRLAISKELLNSEGI